jgi:hypothetical protein
MTSMIVVLALSLSTGVAPPAADAAPRSPALAAELTGLLATTGLDAIAVADPENADRFIAAFTVPGVQLLVVDAKTPTAALVQQRIAAKHHRDVYTELQRPESTEGRIFIYDFNADGLTSEGGDVLYESGAIRAIFNGHPAAQKLSDAAYQELVSQTDEQYSRMLRLLIDALKRPSTR